ncbi:MAG TPA: hypothetical protein VK501_01070 [Baekduia sp.]|uniref:hypothetical protein n=1 Tax=Baekduia sp. TaxID=2600305 RepID=UPI002CE700A7|nr:hypothetical protein [Baekduia sp.]HMJ32478.1 hypothetical protein [Baekduia sp.]
MLSLRHPLRLGILGAVVMVTAVAVLGRRDTHAGSSTSQSQSGVDLDGKGLKRAMQDIKNYIVQGLMP